MTKKIGHRRKGRRARQTPKIKRKSVIIICALLSLTTAIGIAARWKILPGTSKPLALAPAPTTGSLAANSPSKEYIYAGGRLIATEEPATSATSSPTPIPTATSTPTPIPLPSPPAPENVIWTRPFYVQSTGNSLTKSEGTDWDAGAVSSKAIQSGAGYIEFTAAGDPAEVMCGLSHGDSNPYYTDIDFAVHLESGGIIKIREGGVYIGMFGSYQIGDRFRVAVEGSDIKYYRIPQGMSETPLPAPFYTHSAAPVTYPLLFDTSIYAMGGTISNAVISGQLVDSFPPARVNVARQAGATTQASSTMNNDEDSFGASYVNDGDTAGNSGWWADNTSVPPGTPDTDYVDVTFASSRTIEEVDVFGLQENYTNPSEPTAEMTSRFAPTDLNIQYWSGTAWTNIPGASVTGNNKVWTKFTFTPLATTKIRINVTRVSGDNHSQIAEAQAWQVQGYGSNVALSSAGATASASTTLVAGYDPPTTIDGNKRASSWWADNTSNAYPDWLEIQFSGSKTISEVDVIGVQQDYTNPSEPTLQMTSRFALTSFKVQYWTGTSWLTVPGGDVASNDRVWRKFSFTPITTGKIRIYVTGVAGDNHSNVIEVEAYQQ